MKKLILALAMTVASSSVFAGPVKPVCNVNGKMQALKGCRVIRNSIACIDGNSYEMTYTSLKANADGSFSMDRIMTYFVNDPMKRQDVELPSIDNVVCAFR